MQMWNMYGKKIKVMGWYRLVSCGREPDRLGEYVLKSLDQGGLTSLCIDTNCYNSAIYNHKDKGVLIFSQEQLVKLLIISSML